MCICIPHWRASISLHTHHHNAQTQPLLYLLFLGACWHHRGTDSSPFRAASMPTNLAHGFKHLRLAPDLSQVTYGNRSLRKSPCHPKIPRDTGMCIPVVCISAYQTCLFVLTILSGFLSLPGEQEQAA